MAKIQRFEDLIAWQKARELTKKTCEMSRQGNFARDFDLAGQIRRAAVSIMSNIAEGFEREGQREFRQYLSIAKGSCAELRSQLYVAFDCGYLSDGDFANLLKQAEEVGRIIGGLRLSIRKSQVFP
jgi:four helix bundle protein